MFAGEVIMNGAREHGVKNELKCTDIHECTERDAQQKQQNNNETMMTHGHDSWLVDTAKLQLRK